MGPMIDIECAYAGEFILIRAVTVRGQAWLAARLQGPRMIGGAAPVARQAFGRIKAQAFLDNVELAAV